MGFLSVMWVVTGCCATLIAPDEKTSILRCVENTQMRTMARDSDDFELRSYAVLLWHLDERERSLAVVRDIDDPLVKHNIFGHLAVLHFLQGPASGLRSEFMSVLTQDDFPDNVRYRVAVAAWRSGEFKDARKLLDRIQDKSTSSDAFLILCAISNLACEKPQALPLPVECSNRRQSPDAVTARALHFALRGDLENVKTELPRIRGDEGMGNVELADDCAHTCAVLFACQGKWESALECIDVIDEIYNAFTARESLARISVARSQETVFVKVLRRYDPTGVVVDELICEIIREKKRRGAIQESVYWLNEIQDIDTRIEMAVFAIMACQKRGDDELVEKMWRAVDRSGSQVFIMSTWSEILISMASIRRAETPSKEVVRERWAKAVHRIESLSIENMDRRTDATKMLVDLATDTGLLKDEFYRQDVKELTSQLFSITVAEFQEGRLLPWVLRKNLSVLAKVYTQLGDHDDFLRELEDHDVLFPPIYDEIALELASLHGIENALEWVDTMCPEDKRFLISLKTAQDYLNAQSPQTFDAPAILEETEQDVLRRVIIGVTHSPRRQGD